MKHIRVFEGFRDEYYTEISDNEWNEWDLKLLDYEEGRIDKPFIDFPLNQFLMLKSRSVNNEGVFRSNWIFTNDKKYRIIGGGYGGGSFNKSHSGIMWVLNVLVEDFGPPRRGWVGINRQRYWNVTVWYCDDEWYMVKVENKIYKPYEKNVIYYKCDQFEGLVKLFEDNNFIK